MTVPLVAAKSQVAFPPDPIPKIILGGSVNLLAGASGVGKTAFLSGFLKKIRDGAPVFGRLPNAPTKVGILSIDRSWHQSSKLWYDLAGWEDVPHYCLQDDDSFKIERLAQRTARMTIFKECLDRLNLPFGGLAVIDPIAPFLGGSLLDYDACMVACTRIRRECRTRGITVVGVAHAGKQKGDKKERYLRLQDRIIGSASQFGYTDTQMYLAAPEETGEKHYTFLWNPHHAPAETFALGRAENGLFVPWEQGVQALTEERVLEAIPQTAEGIGFSELIIAVDSSRSVVNRVLVELVKNGVVARCGHGRYHRPPTVAH